MAQARREGVDLRLGFESFDLEPMGHEDVEVLDVVMPSSSQRAAFSAPSRVSIGSAYARSGGFVDGVGMLELRG